MEIVVLPTAADVDRTAADIVERFDGEVPPLLAAPAVGEIA